jgi:hypothetical protein
MDPYTGYHSRPFPDSSGYDTFEVYSYLGIWFWSAVDSWCRHQGFREGPFTSARDAYRDATQTRSAPWITSGDDYRTPRYLESMVRDQE